MKFELPPDNRNRPDEELLADLRRVASDLGRPSLDRESYVRLGRFTPKTLANRFGSWNLSLAKAGLAVAKRVDIPTEELLQDLRDVAARLPTPHLTVSLYNSHGRFNAATIERRFGGWRRALQAAGLDFGHVPVEYTPELLLGNLATVWEQLGRPPRKADMRRPLSAFSETPYVRVFGRWRKALEALVASVQEPASALVSEEVQVASAGNSPQVASIHHTSRTVSWRLRFLVMKRDSFACRQCGTSPAKSSSAVLVVDHVFPWSQGGETVFENLQTLCEPCNGGKGADT
jgi:5-methylcytosine-specific restriction endonuclease McrA